MHVVPGYTCVSTTEAAAMQWRACLSVMQALKVLANAKVLYVSDSAQFTRSLTNL